VQLDGSGSTGSSTFQWVGPNGFTSTQQNPTVSFPGTYCLTVSDGGNGCSATDCMKVSALAPTPVLFQSGYPCSGGVVEITSGGYNPNNFDERWTTFDGLITGGANTYNVMIGAPGTYCLTLADPGGGCTSAVCVEVERKLGLQFGGSTPDCKDGQPAIQQPFHPDGFVFERNALQSGLYFFVIHTENQVAGFGKVVVE
jgi:hypothetical protein